MKKHLIVIGAQKAGTTRLQHLFDTNEGYFCPVSSQEIHFFDRHYDKGEAHYLDLYRDAPSDTVTVDVTPAYLTEKEVPERILRFRDQHQIDLKLIVIFREPVSRLLSAYQMRVRRGYSKGLKEAVKDYEDLLVKSSYVEPFKKYVELFGRENILVLVNEEMRMDFSKQCELIQTFLGSDRPLIDKYGSKKVNLGGDRALPSLDRWFRKLGNLMRTLRLHQHVHHIKRSGLIQAIYRFNQRPVILSPQDEDYLFSLKELFKPQVLKLDSMLDQKDLVNQWGYEQE